MKLKDEFKAYFEVERDSIGPRLSASFVTQLNALPVVHFAIFESAFLDGASHHTAFFRLALPLSIPALASLTIFQFLWVWNDLLVALIYLGGTAEVSPLTLRLSSLVNSLGQNWNLLTAAAFISMALPLVLFFSLQRFFVRGILAGSIKG